MLRVTLRERPDLVALGPRWEALEERSDPSFFMTWRWVGCLAAERFADPVLLEATRDGTTVALALFNRGRSRLAPRTLWLGESGQPLRDTVYVEHNAPLVACGEDLLLPCLQAALGGTGSPLGFLGRRLVISGAGDAVLETARRVGGHVRVAQTQTAPYVDLADGGGGSARLSANTRYQLRRAAKRSAARGPLRITPAASPGEAAAWLDALAVLHQATWVGRGRPGAFANPFFRQFHRALIERAWPATELLRIDAGANVLGYLYNFRHRKRMLSYQSGFDYGGAELHEKPGLLAHHLAIERARAAGLDVYDFLAGADRYKTSFATAGIRLHWFEVTPRWSARGLLNRIRANRDPHDSVALLTLD